MSKISENDQDRTVQEKMRLQNELQASLQRSAELAKEFDQLNYAISHDLRAPLRAIDGFSEILLDDYSNKLDEEGKRYLQILRDNSRKLNGYIEALLGISRIGRRTLSHVELDMNDLVAAVCAEFSTKDMEQRIAFDIQTLPPALGDPDLIRELFFELIDNAVKFTRSREKAIIRVTGESGGRENRYFVSDNGIGFDMQYADKLFALFQKLHGQEHSEGSGAGLARVRRIVDRHGGQAWAEGHIDEGATFSFTLPTGVHSGAL